MTVTNLQWLNANAQRKYPCVDEASMTDDTGKFLPNDIISDLHIWSNQDVGTEYFISSVSVTPTLVSVTIARIDSAFPTVLSAAMAISITGPINAYRTYPLDSFSDQEGGWISFGPGINVEEPTHWVFSALAQSEILPALVMGNPRTGVNSLGKENSNTTINGLITMLSGSPDKLVVEKANRTINGVARDALVLRLNESASGHEIHSDYLGPCDKRPESGTCTKDAIFTINGIQPDCPNGQIHFVFSEIPTTEFGNVLQITTDVGKVIVDYGIGLSDICERQDLPIDTRQYVDENCDECGDGDDECDPCTTLENVTRPFDGYVNRWKP